MRPQYGVIAANPVANFKHDSAGNLIGPAGKIVTPIHAGTTVTSISLDDHVDLIKGTISVNDSFARGGAFSVVNIPDPLEPTQPFRGVTAFGNDRFFMPGIRMISLNAISSALVILLLSGFVRMANSYINAEKQKKSLETERLNAELNYLKLQINPHFLFNTLNSIYSQAHLKSEQTAYSVLRFSQIMRYVLYDSSSKKVALAKDLEYINNYIDFQKLRLSKNVRVNYELKGSTQNHTIAPLLLISFIENAFKHGVSYSKPSDINISISIQDDELHLFVSNSIAKNVSKEKGGLGLTNAKRRLDLLYPTGYSLLIDDNGSDYDVNLKIKLTNES